MSTGSATTTHDAVRDLREAVVDGMTVPPGGPDDAFWRGAQWAYGQIRDAMDGYVSGGSDG